MKVSASFGLLWLAALAHSSPPTQIIKRSAKKVNTSAPWEFYLQENYGWQFYPPWTGPADWQKWWHSALNFKEQALASIQYEDFAYSSRNLKWAQDAIISPQAMLHDAFLWDHVNSRWTVTKFLQDLTDRYGGIDSVLLWYPYPNLGVDDRSQWDMFQSLPGGINGVRELVAEFHSHGISVIFPYNPWDDGTHREGHRDPESIAHYFESVRANGCNLDTIRPAYGSSQVWWDAAVEEGYPLGFQAEWGLDFSDVAAGSHKDLVYNVLAWGEIFEGFHDDELYPMGSTARLLEQRHMLQNVDRWSFNKTAIFQSSFVTGSGYVSWENVWGVWVEHAPRYAEALRRWATVARAMKPIVMNTRGDATWFPFTPLGMQDGIWGSLFQGTFEGVKGTAYYWPIINRVDHDYVNVKTLNLPFFEGLEYIDLYHGVAIDLPTPVNGNVTLSVAIEALGYGAILAIPSPRPAFVQALMDKMAPMTKVPLGRLSAKAPVLQQTITPNPRTAAVKSCPSGMIEVPGGLYKFYSQGTMIEGKDIPGVGVQYPWESESSYEHSTVMTLSRFCMDEFLVTSKQYEEFQHAAEYVPNDTTNFLRGWSTEPTASGSVKYFHPDGKEKVPVSWVDLTDARAYATWRGCRLPQEWEWQWAAQGNTSMDYPWGKSWDASKVPQPDTGHTMRGPDPTDAHPEGASVFSGVKDMVGNLHQWTDEYTDAHTRSAVTKGGSNYHPIAPPSGMWYFPQPHKVYEHNKFLLLSPSMDRSGGIGFRCVVDLVA